MPTTVEIPELGDVEFPDSMSHSDIIHAIDAEIMPRVRPPASLRAASSVTAPPEQGRGPDRLADVAALTPSGFPDVPGSERAVGEAIEALQAPTIQVPPEVMKFIVPAEKQIELLFGKEASDAYVQTAADLAGGLTSPQNLAAGATAIATGPIGAAAIGSLFSIDALMNTPEQARRLGEAFGTGDRGQIAAAMTESVALGAQALGVGFVPAAIRQARRMTPRVVNADAEVLMPETAAEMRNVAAERRGPSIDVEAAARPVTPPELPAGEARRLTPVEQALQDRVQQRLLPERVVEEAPPPPVEPPPAPKPAPAAAVRDTLGNESSFYSLNRLKGMQLRGDERLATALKFYGVQDIRQLARVAERRFAERAAPKPAAPVEVAPGPAPASVVAPEVVPTVQEPTGSIGNIGVVGNESSITVHSLISKGKNFVIETRRAKDGSVINTESFPTKSDALNKLGLYQELGGVVEDNTAKTVSKAPKESKEVFAAAREFSDLVTKYGIQEGWIQRAELLDPSIAKAKGKASTASIKANILRSKEQQASKRRAISQFAEPAQREIADPANLAAALPAMKEYLAKKYGPGEAWATATEKGPVKVIGQQLSVGDVMTVEGEKVKVQSIDPDTEVVTLDDGVKFQQQQIGPDEVIFVEQLSQRPPSTEFVPEEPTGQVPKLRSMEKQGDVLATQQEPFKLAGEQGVDFERIQREKQAQERKQRAGEEGTGELPGINRMRPVPPGLGEEITAPSVEDVRAQRALEKRLAEANRNPDPATGAMVERVAAENPPPPMGPDVPTEGGRSGHALGIVPTFVPGPTARFARDLLEQAVKYPLRLYSEPLIEQLARIGGPASREFADVARRIVALAKARIGEMATQDLDAALRSAGKDTEANRWAMTIADTSKRWGYRNLVNAIEGPIDNVPVYARDAVELYRRANSNTGRMAERDIAGFQAGGLFQREPTMFQMDLIRTGHGPGFETLVEALATDNSMPRPVVREILAKTKAEWDKPAAEANLRTIAQEYTRQFKKFPTDLLLDIGPFGKLWVPILHSNPYDYLLQTATRTAQRTAFLRFLPEERLNQYRTRIAAEGGNTARVFDNLVRALHGLPIDEPFLRDFIPPGSPLSLGLSGANQMLSNVFAPLKLTVSTLYNIPEYFFGQTPRFLGWKKYMEGLWKSKELYPHLETIGAVNRAIYNNSLDPHSRARSQLRQFGNGLRRATVQVFFNEAQETGGGSTAYVTAERLRNGSITKLGREEAFLTARMMDFDDAAARQIADGTASDATYNMFVQRAAPFFTGGAMQPAEASQLANRRLFTGLFRFHSYPMMKMNALRELMSGLGDAAKDGTPLQKTAAATIAARYLFGSTAQGLSTLIVKAMAYGGIPALAVLMSQSKDEPGEFWLDIMASDIGGPLSAIWYAQQNEGLLEAFNPEAVNAAMTFPGSMAMELTELLGGHGRFKDMDVQDRITRYFVEKIPAGRIISTVMATVGLSTEDKELDAAVRGFYEWRRENLGYKKVEDHAKADERKAFRMSMGKAMRAIEDQKDPRPFLEEAVGYSKKQTGEAVANSLLARRLLFRPDRSKLTEEDLDKLIENIGLPAVEKLEAHDEMLKTLADEIRRENR